MLKKHFLFFVSASVFGFLSGLLIGEISILLVILGSLLVVPLCSLAYSFSHNDKEDSQNSYQVLDENKGIIKEMPLNWKGYISKVFEGELIYVVICAGLFLGSSLGTIH